MDYQAIAKEILKDVGGKRQYRGCHTLLYTIAFRIERYETSEQRSLTTNRRCHLLLKAAGSIKWF